MAVIHMLCKGLHGFLLGIAAQYILAIGISLYLRLGYLLSYPASFPERLGGEMNTVVIVTLACGSIGAALNVITALLSKRQTH